MTDQERKAMQMALEALENNQPVNYCQNNNGERFPMFKEDPFRFDCNTKAIEALRQALAQGEPIKPSDLLIDTYSVNLGAWSVNNRGVKITHVPTGTVVCSDSERSQHANKRVAMQKLEAALAQPEQEPVAWRWENNGSDNWIRKYTYLDNGAPDEPELCEALYTAPPSKPWVSLTDEEINRLVDFHGLDGLVEMDPVNFARAIEAKLKEKNT